MTKITACTTDNSLCQFCSDAGTCYAQVTDEEIQHMQEFLDNIKKHRPADRKVYHQLMIQRMRNFKSAQDLWLGKY